MVVLFFFFNGNAFPSKMKFWRSTLWAKCHWISSSHPTAASSACGWEGFVQGKACLWRARKWPVYSTARMQTGWLSWGTGWSLVKMRRKWRRISNLRRKGRISTKVRISYSPLKACVRQESASNSSLKTNIVLILFVLKVLPSRLFWMFAIFEAEDRGSYFFSKSCFGPWSPWDLRRSSLVDQCAGDTDSPKHRSNQAYFRGKGGNYTADLGCFDLGNELPCDGSARVHQCPVFEFNDITSSCFRCLAPE